MSLNCGICFERYTPNGTEHALCYITCGHLVGKSCLERWINLNEVDGEFSCPICNQFIVDYFPIHSIPDQLYQNSLDNNDKGECRNEEDVREEVQLEH